jgi:hypothetical protein
MLFQGLFGLDRVLPSVQHFIPLEPSGSPLDEFVLTERPGTLDQNFRCWSGAKRPVWSVNGMALSVRGDAPDGNRVGIFRLGQDRLPWRQGIWHTPSRGRLDPQRDIPLRSC